MPKESPGEVVKKTIAIPAETADWIRKTSNEYGFTDTTVVVSAINLMKGLMQDGAIVPFSEAGQNTRTATYILAEFGLALETDIPETRPDGAG